VSEETPNELREQVDALTKDIGKMRKANEDLAKENRSLRARQAFSEATLSPELADLFVAANPEGDITVDSAKEFATKYGISAPVAEGEEEEKTPKPQPNVEGLDAVSRAGSGAGEGGQLPAETNTMSVSEYVQLLKTNKVAASEALAQGRIRMRDDNPLMRDRVSMGDVNPFDAFNREALESKQS
jgi:hypothetical protein